MVEPQPGSGGADHLSEIRGRLDMARRIYTRALVVRHEMDRYEALIHLAEAALRANTVLDPISHVDIRSSDGPIRELAADALVHRTRVSQHFANDKAGGLFKKIYVPYGRKLEVDFYDD